MRRGSAKWCTCSKGTSRTRRGSSRGLGWPTQAMARRRRASPGAHTTDQSADGWGRCPGCSAEDSVRPRWKKRTGLGSPKRGWTGRATGGHRWWRWSHSAPHLQRQFGLRQRCDRPAYCVRQASLTAFCIRATSSSVSMANRLLRLAEDRTPWFWTHSRMNRSISRSGISTISCKAVLAAS